MTERPRLLLGLASVAVAFAAADTYVVVLALPEMMNAVGVPIDQLQRAAPIVSGFLLGYVAMLPLIGRIADLRGYPVVVNVWASWCGPCRFEFPHFQQAAADYGKRVAFLGVDSEDSDDAANTFLAEAPLPYPHYTDPDSEIKEGLGASLGFPDTAFYDKSGELVYLKQGPYTKDSELEDDVRRYAVGGA